MTVILIVELVVSKTGLDLRYLCSSTVSIVTPLEIQREMLSRLPFLHNTSGRAWRVMYLFLFQLTPRYHNWFLIKARQQTETWHPSLALHPKCLLSVMRFQIVGRAAILHLTALKFNNSIRNCFACRVNDPKKIWS